MTVIVSFVTLKARDEAPAVVSPSGNGRLVMLVDNAVTGDSRVQKEARSAAEAGWDVVLLGIARGSEESHWSLGDVDVRLLCLGTDLRLRPREFQPPRRHRLLAYRPGRLVRFRTRQLTAWEADLAARRSGRTGAALITLWPLRLRLAFAGAWIRARLACTRRLTPAASSTTARTNAAPDWARRAVRRWPWLRHGKWLAAPLYWRRSPAAAMARRRTGNTWTDRLRVRLWTSLFPRRGWRWLHPHLWSYELAMGPVIDELAPDLIHANDFRMIGVGARAKLRAATAGRDVRLVWDAHEYIPGTKPPADRRWLPAVCAHEAEYARHADAVLTVSDELARLLQARHRLPRRPAVVLNAPDITGREPVVATDIRAACGLRDDDPLLVYSGAAAEQRGLRIMVQTLPRLPGVHVAFVVPRPGDAFVRAQVALAERLGVADRLHVLDYVPHDQVVPFLAGADAGVIPIHHWPNHELALITKFFEYSHARLPLIVSDVRTMAATVRRTGQGEVFTAQNAGDYLRAVETVLADAAVYRKVYTDGELLENWTWHRQAGVLLDTYRQAMAPPA
ncbi:hypothetical protein Pen01_51270 [Phytomonospora endophytica]|nr:hypothetical protein Pen01_51270 [Phytomonospora endophytica]